MNDITQVFSLDETSEAKFSEVKNCFTGHFKVNPEFYVRCPGRVNIIGEHIDYSGFPVLPMAIENDVIIAVAVNQERQFNIHNLDVLKYEPCQITNEIIDVDSKHCHWYDYVLCGYKGIAEKFDLKFKFLNIVVKGTIPPSSGLSSSSALVCAGALATVFSNGIPISRTDLAELCATSERYIGTQGGGMDQAIIFLGAEGYAKKIEFNPLKTTDVQLPKDLHFIVAHSGVTVNKAKTSDFNKRVAECLLAAKILSKLSGTDWKVVQRLADVPAQLKKTLAEMINYVEELLLDTVYTREDICKVLEINDLELKEILTKYEASDPTNFETFENGTSKRGLKGGGAFVEAHSCLLKLEACIEITKRATHVYNEAFHVQSFIQSCEREDFTEIGGWLTKSHKSLAENYNCSHEELDALVELALASGAIGARLTGAGWGGCMIAAVRSKNKDQLLDALTAHVEKKGLPKDYVFLTKPSSGAALYK